MNKKKYKFCLVFMVFWALSFFLLYAGHAGAQNYTLLEKIPPGSTSSDWAGYILSIYKFGIWAVGIAALFMIMVGGIMYIASAGNNTAMTKAKGIIQDAVIGLILALSAYVILYEINPDLLQIRTPSDSSMMGGGGGNTGSNQACIDWCNKSGYTGSQLDSCKAGCPPPSNTNPGGQGNGNCQPAQSGDCAPGKFDGTCFAGMANQASAICQAESHGVEGLLSNTDKCSDGSSFSVGLFQINTTCQCPSAYSSNGCAKLIPGTNKYNCTSNGSSSCVENLKGNAANIQKACEIQKQQGWNAWSVNKPVKGSPNCGF